MPDAGDRSEDLALMVRATRAAGTLAMSHFTGGTVRQWDKSPNNPVSDADLAVDAYLKTQLLDKRPDYGWLSEETVDDPARLGRARVWVVDPIDGTRDFLRGRTGWTVSVALVEDGRVVLGALAAPARGQMFVGQAGRGAHRDGVRLRVTGRTAMGGLSMPIDPGSLHASFWPEPWDAVAVEKPNSLALRIAKIASGEADVFLEGRTIAEWDIAAATLILTEAGGTATDRDGAALAFNQPSPAVRGLVAATPALHGDARLRLGGALATLAARRNKVPNRT